MQPPPGYSYGPAPPRGAGPHAGPGHGGSGPPSGASSAYAAGYAPPSPHKPGAPPTPQHPQHHPPQHQQQHSPYGSYSQLPQAGQPQAQQQAAPQWGAPAGGAGYGAAAAGYGQQQHHQQPYVAAVQQQQQQQQQYGGYGAPAGGYSMPYQPAPPDQGMGVFGGGAPGGGAAGPNFMSGLNPLSMMAAGGLLSAPQAYMQQRMGWLKTNMTGGTMSALFNVTPSYAVNKLLMLCAPFLKRWTYTRLHEQIAGGQKYRPPAADVNAPDLFVPLMAAWTYALLNCALLAARGAFKPEALSNLVYGTCIAWGVHWAAAWLVLRSMGVPGVPWSELLAYTGYPFAAVAPAVLAQQLAGRSAYYTVWGYGCLCMGVFMVRTMKRVIFQEARQYAHDLKLTNYLLLALAAFQFPWAWWLGFPPKG